MDCPQLETETVNGDLFAVRSDSSPMKESTLAFVVDFIQATASFCRLSTLATGSQQRQQLSHQSSQQAVAAGMKSSRAGEGLRVAVFSVTFADQMLLVYFLFATRVIYSAVRMRSSVYDYWKELMRELVACSRS